MKKLVALFLAIVLSAGSALAEGIDLSGMSYDELVALKDRINLAMWQSDEWQEVTVPQGVWKVGEDIPAGHWTVKCITEKKCYNTQISWGEALTEGGTSIAWRGRYDILVTVKNPEYKYYEYDGSITEYSFTVQDGDYIIIDDAPAVFTPYQGKPSLGFK